LVVEAPFVRFYAGAPLITPEGFRIGTLCVIDSVPRKISHDQIKSLQALARQVVGQLEMLKANAQLKQNSSDLNDSKNKYNFLVDQINEVVFQTDRFGNLKFLNKAWTDITGFSIQESIGKNFLSYIHPDDKLKKSSKN
jgi:PAS domain-containing protein